MRLSQILLSATLLVSSPAATALNPLPVDPEVRTGTLPNGLTYYLRHNDTPASQADFFIAMHVGSINEENNQRGLAHFLEHMCFNGTRHFPGNSLISYLESLGVKFGANLNAYTSTDETVYNICEVPTSRTSALDSCLLILRDWSNDLTLDPEEIDNERGVIKGEWRQRSASAGTRLLEKALPEIYPGSIYGQRMPIGSMEVVDTFKPEQLSDYYKKWYHPQNQCIVVVGDINVDRTEQQIKSMWADLKAPAGATRFETPAIPGNASPIAVVKTDPEQTASMLSVYVKHPSLPDSLDNTIASLRYDVTRSMVTEMLAERLTEVENAPGSPIFSTAIGDMRFLLSRSQQALTLRAPVKKGRATEGVGAIATELKRAARHGFLATEFERAGISERAAADKAFAERKSTTNTDYAKRYVRHYLDGGPLCSAEQTYKMLKGVIGSVKLEDCNRYMSSLVKESDADVVMVAYLPDADTTTPAELTAAYTSVDPMRLDAYVDKAVAGNLLDKEPLGGTIVKEEKLNRFGADLWTLSNGIKVYLRPSADEPDRISISGYSPGGFSQNYDPGYAAEYKMFNDVMAVSATAGHTGDNLRRMLVGKHLNASVAVENMEESVGVSSSKADLADAFRLLYLKATSMQRDDAAFNRLIDNTRTRLGDNSDNPTFAMGDSIHAYVYGHHPLGMKITAGQLDRVDYDRIMKIYADRFGDMSDFTFFITGDFSTDSIKPLVEQYIGALPGQGRMEKPRDINYRYGTSPAKTRFTMPMQTPQTITYTFYHAPCDFTLANRITAQITGTLLQNKLRDDLREKRGWTYGVKSHIGLNAGYNGDDPALAIMPVYIRVSPENADSTFAIVDATMRGMASKENISTEELAKVKEYLAKNHAAAQRSNSYWESVMRVYEKFGIDMNRNYQDVLKSVTTADVAGFCKTVLLPAHRMQLEMSPEP